MTVEALRSRRGLRAAALADALYPRVLGAAALAVFAVVALILFETARGSGPAQDDKGAPRAPFVISAVELLPESNFIWISPIN